MKQILVIYTGGTIGMHHDHKGVLRPFDFQKINEQIPELKRLNAVIHHYAFEQLIDSSNVQPQFWINLTTLIVLKHKDYDGFVILHGTDTMAYSASALSFMLENLDKPVIFTGSQLPLGVIRTDAKRNLITAIELAAGEVLIPEVCIYFSSKLFRGNRVEKFTSSQFDAFQSLNYPALAETGVDIQYNYPQILPVPKRKIKVHIHLNPHIGLIRIFPGITGKWMNNVLSSEGLKAVVLETYGSGNAPTDAWFIQSLQKAIEKGIVILNVSQCSGGRVEQGKYETSYHLKKMGVISGADITTEAALTKLMFLFGQNLERKKIEKMMQQALRGEMTL